MTTAEAIHEIETASPDYARLKPHDALAHFNERLAAEAERFERDTGLLLASIKVVRDKEDDSLKALKAHVR